MDPELVLKVEEAYDALLARLQPLGEGTRVDTEYTIQEAVDADLKEYPLPPEVEPFVRCYLSDLYVADMSKCSLRGMVSEG